MIDILYVNYNSSQLLINSIKSVYGELGDNINFNIYLWDNNSTDNVQDIIKEFPDVNVHLSNINIGFSKAINQLLKRTKAPYLVILNPDTIVDKGFLNNSIEFLKENIDIGLIGPKVLNIDGTVQGSARKFPTPLTALFGRNSLFTKLFPRNSITKKNVLTINNRYSDPVEVDWVSGACMVVRREAMEDVGGFDENFFLYWEDADICRRIKDAGWKVSYNPKVQIFHHVGKSSQFAPYRSIYQFHKSCYYLCCKYTKWPLSLFLPFTFLGLTARGIMAILYHVFLKQLKRIEKGKSERQFRIDIIHSNPSKKESVGLSNGFNIPVLHIITRLIVGGAQENTIYSAELMDGSKYNIDVLSGAQTGAEGSLIENARTRGVRLTIQDKLVREINPRKDICAFLQLLKFMRHNRYDIVHTHSSKAGILGRWAAWCSGVPVIVHTVHGWGFHSYQRSAIRRFYILAERLSALITDRLIAVTRKDIEKGVAAGIGSKKQYELIRSGIDLKQFSNNNLRKSSIRAELRIPANATVIGTVTRLSQQKAPHVFIEMAAMVNERTPGTFFVIVGGGPLQVELEQLAEKLGIGKLFLFTGIRDDVQDVLHAFDIFMLTSLWEGLPRVIPQAIASGVPVIASRVDGNAEIINHNENGLLVEPGNAGEFAEAAIDLINNREKTIRIRNNAAKNIDEYSVHTMVEKIDRLYKEIQ